MCWLSKARPATEVLLLMYSREPVAAGCDCMKRWTRLLLYHQPDRLHAGPDEMEGSATEPTSPLYWNVSFALQLATFRGRVPRSLHFVGTANGVTGNAGAH